MTARLRLAYVPLVDAAPLLLARALGFAEEEGLALELVPCPSWALLRDALALGQVEAAQMLAPLPVAQALGLGRSGARFEALYGLNLNGNVVGVSRDLADRMARAGHEFGFEDAVAAGSALLGAQDVLRIGVPLAFSMHLELLQYWLSALGARAGQLEIRTIPPQQMAEALAQGEIDAFCVGEPWGSVAVARGAGVLLLPTSAIWAGAPEKVLATRAGWAQAEPRLAGGVMRALWRAGRWLDAPENRMIAAEMLGSFGVEVELIERALSGRLILSQSGIGAGLARRSGRRRALCAFMGGGEFPVALAGGLDRAAIGGALRAGAAGRAGAGARGVSRRSLPPASSRFGP